MYIQGGSGTYGIMLRDHDGSDRWSILNNGDLYPMSDSTYDIGSNSQRVANGYFDTLYGDGSNLTALNIVTDTSPQLGGNLDLNGSNITGTGNINITGGLTTSATSTIGGELNLMNGSTDATRIIDASIGTNQFLIRGTSGGDANHVTMLYAKRAGEVALHYSGSKKFETTSSGVSVTGNVLATGNVQVNDNAHLYAGNSADLDLYHNGTDSYIDSSTNDLVIRSNGDDLILRASDDIFIQPQSGENGITVIGNGAVELYHDGSRQVFTIDGGMNWQDNKNAEFGNSGDLKIYHTGSENHIKGTGSHTLIFSTNNAERWGIESGGHLKPHANDSYDLGTSSYRIRNIYTQDLQLSNEARKDKGGNDVDGTWGDWTLQEGEEEIFMINNRTGKKYAMMLREVA